VQVQKIAPNIATVYLSLEGRSLNNIKPGQPGASLWMAGFDIDDFSGSIPQAVKAAGGRYWAPYYKHLTRGLLNEAHELGFQVFVWTPDKRSDMVRLIGMGVDGIITNRPDILKSVVSPAAGLERGQSKYKNLTK
jgi:glycerophosphoryl diester phosphodiesterase